jgi:hypothetical protein
VQQLSQEGYKQLADELNFILDEVINSLLALGAVLVACMSILWAKDIWRKEPGRNKHTNYSEGEGQLIINSDKSFDDTYENTTRAAISMAFAYFCIAGAVVKWIVIPLYNNYSQIKTLLK